MKTPRLLRTDAVRIRAAALQAVDPQAAVRRWVRRHGHNLLVRGRRYDLRRFQKVWVIGAGKAAAPMGRAIEGILGRLLAGGMLVTKYGHSLPLRKLEILEAGHPLPDENSCAAGKRFADWAKSQVGPKDLVVCLLSGGGSALLAAPAPGLEWRDKQQCTAALLRSGADIREMNAVRKHLSALKGGGLARLLSPTPVISLILSDVVGDVLDTIASGPLVPDPTTFADCLAVLQRLGITGDVPAPVLRHFREGAAGRIPETPKAGDTLFRNNRNFIVGSNAQACAAAAAAARSLGYHTMVLTSRATGDTGESARFHVSIAEEIVYSGRPLRRPACLISGGETTVRVTGNGLGGRNQEFALHCVRPLAQLPVPCLAASFGTDGVDGPTDAAGAIADNTSWARAREHGTGFLDTALRGNDSYRFFRKLGDLIMTGPTRTNVMDLHILLIGDSERRPATTL